MAVAVIGMCRSGKSCFLSQCMAVDCAWLKIRGRYMSTMRFLLVRPVMWIGMIGFVCGSLLAQTVTKPSGAASNIEPGLEVAVNWKWWVAPPVKHEWGVPLPEALVIKTPGTTAHDLSQINMARPETYTVKKGDAIIKIARKFDMTVWQLKQFNELKDDLIHIGQILRIPTPGQLLTLVPPPPPAPKVAKLEVSGKKKPATAVGVPESDPDIDSDSEAQLELDNVRVQVFLDREQFSPGVIDGKAGATFLKISQIYMNTHADAATPDQLKAKAEAALKQPYTSYTLRAEDFKFIQPPADVPAAGGITKTNSASKKHPKPAKPAPKPRLITIDDRLAASFLGYTNAWEFVAERFHCDEAFLHRINPALKEVPAVGTEFQVPHVIAFEIEKALDPPLQPAANPQKPVTAAVVLVTRLEISCEGKLIAVMPLTSARPGLHGRGSWTVLDAIAQPRMATKREPRVVPKASPTPTEEVATNKMPVIEPILENEQFLASGPNNPVGIIWINLAKAGSTDALPYGLHGTSIPAQMGTRQSLGGLRLTNWDIARATRLIPAGTALQWKARSQ